MPIKNNSKDNNTVVDLAKALGISVSTVSRALNNDKYVKEDTRQKVVEMAKKLGYQKNQMAAGLRSKKSFTIGLIIPRLSMTFHASVITTVQNELYRFGYNLIICQSNDSLQKEKELTQAIFSSRVDGVIVACTLETIDFSHFDIFIDNNIPLVFYDRVPINSYKASFVKGDDYKGGCLVAQHLIEAGCKKIAHISGPLTSNLYLDRFAGFKKTLEQNNIPIYDDLIFYQELTYDNARIAIEKIFKGKNIPDAIFTANDTSAIAVLEYAREHSIAVPEKLKIVGYSNDPRTSIITPSITTVEQFPDLVGKNIVEELMKELLEKKNNKEEQKPWRVSIITTPVELIKRMSS